MSKSIEDYKTELMQYYAAHRALPVAARPVRPIGDGEITNAQNMTGNGDTQNTGDSQSTDNSRNNGSERNTDGGRNNGNAGSNFSNRSTFSGQDTAERQNTADDQSRTEKRENADDRFSLSGAQNELPRPDAQIEYDTRREHEGKGVAPPSIPEGEYTRKQTVTDYEPPKAPEKGQMGEGSLVVFVTHSRGLYPVENATVRVAKKSGEPIVTERTDSSGKTPPLTLPAPSKIYSETPGENAADVSEGYDVRIDADGFVSVIIQGVPIFDGVKTLQPIDLVSLSAAPGPGPTVIKCNNSYTL